MLVCVFAFNLLRMSRMESSAVINTESLVVLDLRKWSGSYDGTRFHCTFLIRMNSGFKILLAGPF